MHSYKDFKMKNLFIVYKSYPYIVYASSQKDAEDITSSEIKDKGIVFEDLTKQILTKEDIPKDKKKAHFLSLPEDFATLNQTIKPLNVSTLFNEISKTKPKINFEYCECGCHGLSCVIGNRELSLLGVFDTQVKHISYWLLYDGHVSAMNNILGKFTNYEEAALAAEKIFKKDLEELQNALTHTLE